MFLMRDVPANQVEKTSCTNVQSDKRKVSSLKAKREKKTGSQGEKIMNPREGQREEREAPEGRSGDTFYSHHCVRRPPLQHEM